LHWTKFSSEITALLARYLSTHTPGMLLICASILIEIGLRFNQDEILELSGTYQLLIYGNVVVY